MDLPVIEVQEPWFGYLVNGPKKVEGRKASPKWLELMNLFEMGQPYVVLIDQNGRRELFEITDIRRYFHRRPYQPGENFENWVRTQSSVRIYLEQEGLRNSLPGIQILEEGVDIYRQWSTDQELINSDFLAIEMVHRRSL